MRRWFFRPAPTTDAPNEPLPERMAIGGPNPTSVDVEQNAQLTSGNQHPNVPAVKPSTTIGPDTQSHSGSNYHRRYSGDAPPQRGSGRGRLSLPRRNLLMSLGGLY